MCIIKFFFTIIIKLWCREFLRKQSNTLYGISVKYGNFLNHNDSNARVFQCIKQTWVPCYWFKHKQNEKRFPSFLPPLLPPFLSSLPPSLTPSLLSFLPFILSSFHFWQVSCVVQGILKDDYEPLLPCFNLSSARMTKVHHHVQFMWGRGLNSGIYACWKVFCQLSYIPRP